MSSTPLDLSQCLGQTHYGEEDLFFQNNRMEQNYCNQPKEILLELLQQRKGITWNIRFRWCMWILRKLDTAPESVNRGGIRKKRKWSEITTMKECRENDIYDILLLVLEGIYSELRIFSAQTQETKNVWQDDTMLRYWLLPLHTVNKVEKVLVGNKKFRIGISRFLCLKDLKHTFDINKSDVNFCNNTVTFFESTLSLFPNEEYLRKEAVFTGQKTYVLIENTLKLIINTIDLFVVNHYRKISNNSNNCSVQKEKLLQYNKTVQNLSQSICSSSEFDPYDFSVSNRTKRDIEGSLFREHIYETSKKYAVSFQERYEIQSKLTAALKTVSGRDYLECLLKGLLEVDINTHISSVETHSFRLHHTIFSRGKALLIAYLMNLLSCDNSEAKNDGDNASEKLFSYLRPSPIPSFFGLNKKDFSNLVLGQSNVAISNKNQSGIPIHTNFDKTYSNIEKKHSAGILHVPLDHSETNQFPYKITTHPIFKPRLEYCIESFLNGTTESMEQSGLIKFYNTSIFDGFGPLKFSDNLTNAYSHTPDVTGLTNNLFDILIHTSIASSSTEIDSVADDDVAIENDVDSILHMAKAFGKWFTLDSLVRKFQILLYVLLTCGRIDLINMTKIYEFVNHSSGLSHVKRTELCQWAHAVFQRIHLISLSSKLKLLIHVMTYLELVYESTDNMLDGSQILQNENDDALLSSFGHLWLITLNNFFSRNLLLSVAWEHDLAISVMNTDDNRNKEHLKSTFASKLIFYYFTKRIFASLEKCSKSFETKTPQYLQNFSWLLYSMSDFLPCCFQIIEAIDSIQDISLHKKLYKLNKRINTLYIKSKQFKVVTNYNDCQQISYYPVSKLNLTSIREVGDEEVPPFDEFSKQIILFALTSSWNKQKATTWCNYIGENIISNVYLSKDERMDKGVRSKDGIPCYMIRTWFQQIFQILLAKANSTNNENEDKSFFSSLLRTLHSSILTNIFERVENDCSCAKKRNHSVRGTICISMILMEIKRIEMVQKNIVVPLMKETLCNTETAFLFRSICLPDENMICKHPDIHKTVRELLRILGDSLTCVAHLLVGVGLLIDNKLERTMKDSPNSFKDDSGFDRSPNSQIVFQITSSIIDYFGEKEIYSNKKWTWSLLSKTIHLKLKSKRASFGSDWWVGVMKEVNSDIIPGTKKDDNNSLSDLNSESNESQSTGEFSLLSHAESKSFDVKFHLDNELKPPHSIDTKYENMKTNSLKKENISLKDFLKSQTRSFKPKDIHQEILADKFNQETPKAIIGKRNISNLPDFATIESSLEEKEISREGGLHNWRDDNDSEEASDDEILFLSLS